MKEIKIGDWVSSEQFKGIRQIEATATGEKETRYWVENTGHTYTESELKLVCGFVKGQRIEVDNYCNLNNPYTMIFNQYRPELEQPFECVLPGYESKFKNGENFGVVHFQYARAIEPKYKKYKEPKIEWIKTKKVLINKENGKKYVIESIGYETVFQLILVEKNPDHLSSKYYVTLKDLVGNWTWEDGSVCGEEIK